MVKHPRLSGSTYHLQFATSGGCGCKNTQGIPRMKPDAKDGADAVAGFYKEVGVMTNKVRREATMHKTHPTSPCTTERATTVVLFKEGGGGRSVGELCRSTRTSVVSRKAFCWEDITVSVRLPRHGA